MTLVKVPTDQRDCIAKEMADFGYTVRFYTIENNPDVMQLEIDESDPVILFYLGKACGSAITFKNLKKLV